MNKQAELIKSMSDREVLLNVYVTQIGMLIVAFLLGLFLFDSWSQFFQLFTWDITQILFLAGGVGVTVIIGEVILVKILPSAMLDDGGINERVFLNRSVLHIFILTLFIAIAEEILFRGVLQTHFGYVQASIIFALIHIRYLGKFVLFIVTVALSFILGWLFIITNNLLVPIFCHFLIDFILGLLIKLRFIQ